MRYRRATIGDAATLAEMRWDFRLEEAPGETAHSRAEFLPCCADFIAGGIASGEWTYWIAENDAEIIACICVLTVVKIPKPNRLRDAFGYVTNVYTRPAYRNQGVGSELIREVIAWAKEQELGELIVSPSERSVPYYRRAGFAPDEEMLRLELRPYVL